MDDRLLQVEEAKNAALTQSNNTYSKLLDDNQNLYNQQMENLNQQQAIQNETLDKQLAQQRSEIEQQKTKAQQAYKTESNKASNAYSSYINPYGVNAESMASRGLTNSGVSETSKLGAFNTYQNRLATANQTLQNAITQYDTS